MWPMIRLYIGLEAQKKISATNSDVILLEYVWFCKIWEHYMCCAENICISELLEEYLIDCFDGEEHFVEYVDVIRFIVT